METRKKKKIVVDFLTAYVIVVANIRRLKMDDSRWWCFTLMSAIIGFIIIFGVAIHEGNKTTLAKIQLQMEMVKAGVTNAPMVK